MIIIKVIKRSGKKVKFNRKKIMQAIYNVFKEFGKIESSNEVNRLTNLVEDKVKEKYDEPHVEEIQDIVENVLIEEKYIEIAKAYIKYREKHAIKRKAWIKDDLSLSIWTKKYQFEGESFEEFFDRIAGKDEYIRKIIKEKKFLPAGRILANRGLNKHGIKVSYSNCYVSQPVEDNIESIFDTAKRIARTFSYGGGVGLQLNNLRPRGARVNNASKTTTGAVSFMDIYDVTSKIIGNKGRRAALMLSLDIDHPDIEEFIDVKNDLDAVTKANISVRMKDNFMKSLKNNEKEFNLNFKVKDTGEEINKKVNPTKLFNKVAYSNWKMAEPGMLFWDRIKNWNLLSEDDEFEYENTNPCGELPLPAGGTCLLGSVNLSELVENPFTDKARFKLEEFSQIVRKSVNYLNEVLEEGIELHPHKYQREAARNWKPIGLGQMGLGSMLIKMGIKYGSKESLHLCDEIGFTMINAALQQSVLLAKEKGSYPKYNEKAVLQSDFLFKNATDETLKMITEYGLRNSQLLTTAPTGSISNLIGVSGGIEPIFKVSYIRKTESLHEEDTEYKIFDNTVKQLMEVKGIEEEENLPDYVVDASDIYYKKRIDMQSVWQQYIDSSISSTINLDNKTTVDEIKKIYMYAWKKGLKGITVYRDGCAREGILKVNNNDDNKQKMNKQDFIDQNICPECQSKLYNTGGCRECRECGFSVCST